MPEVLLASGLGGWLPEHAASWVIPRSGPSEDAPKGYSTVAAPCEASHAVTVHLKEIVGLILLESVEKCGFGSGCMCSAENCCV